MFLPMRKVSPVLTIWIRSVALGAAICFVPTIAWSAIEPFPLYSTGAGTSQGDVDANYSLTSVPGGGAGTAYHTVPAAKWNGWNGTADPDVGWVSDRPDSRGLGHAVGDYRFQQSFSLAGFQSDAEIDLDILVDNRVRVLLNGNDVSGGFVGHHINMTNLVINDDSLFNFLGGNTLTFVVRNFDGPVGHPMGLWVRVNSAAAQVVPEPGTLAMWGGGLLIGLIALRRRSRKSA
jgi:hypothetical protein